MKRPLPLTPRLSKAEQHSEGHEKQDKCQQTTSGLQTRSPRSRRSQSCLLVPLMKDSFRQNKLLNPQRTNGPSRACPGRLPTATPPGTRNSSRPHKWRRSALCWARNSAKSPGPTDAVRYAGRAAWVPVRPCPSRAGAGIGPCDSALMLAATNAPVRPEKRIQLRLRPPGPLWLSRHTAPLTTADSPRLKVQRLQAEARQEWRPPG
nr:MAP6 domain-containing protein 1 isoform X1 [Oryctolagus cuniculus]